MKYMVFFALIAAVSAADTINFMEDGKAEASVIHKKKGESVTFHCVIKTGDWSLTGIDGIDIEKRQETLNFAKVNDKTSIQNPFQLTDRFSVAEYEVPVPVDNVYTCNAKVTISALKVEDTGTYRCALVRTEFNVVTVRLNSSEVTFNVLSAPSVSLSSDLMSPDPNKTITEKVNNKVQFNWEVSEQVSITCEANGGYPKPEVTVRRNDVETLPATRKHSGETFTGDVPGLKTPTYNAMVTVNSYVPKTDDKSIQCSAKVPDLDAVKTSAKVVLSGLQLDVSCPPKNFAKLDEKNFKVMCTITTSDPLSGVTLSTTGFPGVACEKKGEEDYTRAGDGVFCRYNVEPSSENTYSFHLKISNVDSGKFQKYNMIFTNSADQKVETSISIEKDPNSGEVGGVSTVLPTISLLLFSLFLAL